MTYLAILTKLLLQQLPVKYEYIDDIGSAHPAENLLPPHLEYNFNNNWDDWFNASIKNYTYNNVCVFKDSWASTDLSIWEEKLNYLDNNYCIISSPLNKIDWYYCWFNFAQKFPSGLYGELRIKNLMFPIWHLLKNKHKFKSFVKSMPVFPLKENLQLSSPSLRFASTDIFRSNFLDDLNRFLDQNKFKATLTEDITNFHSYFISKQQKNYELAIRLTNNEKWQPRDMFDKILFEWADTNPWAELE